MRVIIFQERAPTPRNEVNKLRNLGVLEFDKDARQVSQTWNIKHNFIERPGRKMSENTAIREQPEFTEQQLIWGKVTGHPWWPGIISILPDKLGKKLYRVDFFGDPPTHSILPSSKILKYEEYSKTLNQGRPGPQLKRAIYEASIFQSTIQQSKISQDLKDPPTRITQQKNIFAPPSICKIVEEELVPPSLSPSKQAIELKSPISEETIGQLTGGNTDCKNSPRSKNSRGRIKKIKFSQKRQIKCSRREKHEQVEQVLRKYKLYQIPKPVKGEEKEKGVQPIDIQRLVMRKLYKILRIKASDGQQAQEKTLRLKGKIGSCYDLKDLIKALEQDKQLNDY